MNSKSMERRECLAWITTLLAALTFVASIVVPLIISNKEDETNKPRFAVTYPIHKTINSDIFNYQDITILNLTHNYFSDLEVVHSAYLKVEYTISNKNALSTFYIPLKNYFLCAMATGDVEDIVYDSYLGTEYTNWEYYFNLYKDALEISKNNVFFDIHVLHLAQISCKDIHEETQTSWYIDSKCVPQKEYMDIYNLSKKRFGDQKYEIDLITIWDVVKLAN